LKAADEATRVAFLQRPSVVYQAGFFDSEFHGYADFVELAENGWIVCDAKLARSAKPKALLQLGAYVEQLRRMLQEHRIGGVSVQWGDERYAACGRCDECEAAAEKANDLLLVAGLNVAAPQAAGRRIHHPRGSGSRRRRP
jgi:predicted RecB family nuclease